MLRAPNAGEVMVTVGSRRRIVRAMSRPASIVMDGSLVIPIDNVERAIWPYSRMNRTEPEIGTGQELRIFAPGFLSGDIGCSIGCDHVIMDQAYSRFMDENIIVPS